MTSRFLGLYGCQGGQDPGQAGSTGMGRAGAGALSGGREERSKGWQLRGDLVAFTSIRRFPGGTT